MIMKCDSTDSFTYSEEAPLVSSSASPASSASTSHKKDPHTLTVQEVLDEAQWSVIHVSYLVGLSLIALADSMQACYIAIVLPTLMCEWGLSPTEVATLTSLTFMGTGVGSILIGPLSDRFGRKVTAMVTSFVLFLSMLLCSMATGQYFFLVFSVVSGVCVGGTLSISYTYWSEVCSNKHRDIGVLVLTMCWNFGVTAAFGTGWLMMNSAGWRVVTIALSLPALVAVLIVFVLPESPKYLNRMGRTDKLKSALRKILGKSPLSFNLEEITIQKEVTAETYDIESLPVLQSILHSFHTIFSEDLRLITAKMIASYSCLQTLYKGLLYVITAMLAADYCGMAVTSSRDPVTSSLDGCATLSDGDLLNAIFLSIPFFAATVVCIYLKHRFKEVLMLKVFALLCLVTNLIMLVCLPVAVLYINLGLLGFGASGMALIFYILLPQLYPTVARNSGFGLVDGVGKLVASAAIFAITAVVSYSVRGAIGLLIGISVLNVIQALFINDKEQPRTISE